MFIFFNFHTGPIGPSVPVYKNIWIDMKNLVLRNPTYLNFTKNILLAAKLELFTCEFQLLQFSFQIIKKIIAMHVFALDVRASAVTPRVVVASAGR